MKLSLKILFPFLIMLLVSSCKKFVYTPNEKQKEEIKVAYNNLVDYLHKVVDGKKYKGQIPTKIENAKNLTKKDIFEALRALRVFLDYNKDLVQDDNNTNEYRTYVLLRTLKKLVKDCKMFNDLDEEAFNGSVTNAAGKLEAKDKLRKKYDTLLEILAVPTKEVNEKIIKVINEYSGLCSIQDKTDKNTLLHNMLKIAIDKRVVNVDDDIEKEFDPKESVYENRLNIILDKTISENPDNLGLKNNEGKTPFHLLVTKNRTDSIRKIQSKGIPIQPYLHIKDQKGNIPFFDSISTSNSNKSNKECVQLLYAADPSQITATNDKNQNALHMCTMDDHILGFLLAKGVGTIDINQQDSDGNTPLHLLVNALSNSHETTKSEVNAAQDHPAYQGILKLIGARGIRKDIRNNEGKTPSDLVSILKNKGDGKFKEIAINAERALN